MKDDLKLEDGSFIKGGTSFFVEGFKKGEFEVHFEAREDNTYILGRIAVDKSYRGFHRYKSIMLATAVGIRNSHSGFF